MVVKSKDAPIAKTLAQGDHVIGKSSQSGDAGAICVSRQQTCVNMSMMYTCLAANSPASAASIRPSRWNANCVKA